MKFKIFGVEFEFGFVAGIKTKEIRIIPMRAAQVIVLEEKSNKREIIKKGFVAINGNPIELNGVISLDVYENYKHKYGNDFSFGKAVGNSAEPTIKNGQIFIYKKCRIEDLSEDISKNEFLVLKILKHEGKATNDIGGYKLRRLKSIDHYKKEIIIKSSEGQDCTHTYTEDFCSNFFYGCVIATSL